MRNVRLYAKLGVFLFSLLIIAVFWLDAVIETNKNISNPNFLVYFAIKNHIAILIALILLSVAYGFAWSSVLYREVEQKKRDSKSVLETVFLFLGSEEKSVIRFLVQHRGSTTQAEISRLPGMNRVKAYRSLQRMGNKGLIEVIPHGKTRRIKLRENILNILMESPA